MRLPADPLDQFVLVYVLIGLLIAAFLGPKDWAEFRTTHPVGQALIGWKAVAGTLLAILLGTLSWPIYLAVRISEWSLGHPRFVRWLNRKLAERAAATAVVHQEEDWFIARAVRVDVVRRGHTEEEARASLREAVELHLASQGHSQ